jgi:hypothetical protein
MPASWHSIDMSLSGNAGEIFRHAACVSFGRNSVLMEHLLNDHSKRIAHSNKLGRVKIAQAHQRFYGPALADIPARRLRPWP